jgi:hypothetical protein
LRPATRDELVPIAEIGPVHAAAYRLAELRGVEAGRFRYISQITNDETTLRNLNTA